MKKPSHIKWFRKYQEFSNSYAQIRRERWLNRYLTFNQR